MDISARTMYGLRALVTLARVRSNQPLSIQAIAELEDETGLPVTDVVRFGAEKLGQALVSE